jgi:phosphonate utilization transcriptional regulator
MPPDAANALAVLRNSSLKSVVQEELARMILEGEIAAGERLNEMALSVRFGVSRGPVREAFRALEESGLLVNEKNRGVFVREISVAEAQEIYEVREALEVQVVRKLARSATSEQLQELATLLEAMDAAASDVDAYHPLNLKFHDRLVELTGNAKLLGTYRRLVNELQLFRRRALASGGLAVSNREHRTIVDAIAARNPQRAAAALRQHICGSRARMHEAVNHQSTTDGEANNG